MWNYEVFLKKKKKKKERERERGSEKVEVGGGCVWKLPIYCYMLPMYRYTKCLLFSTICGQSPLCLCYRFVLPVVYHQSGPAVGDDDSMGTSCHAHTRHGMNTLPDLTESASYCVCPVSAYRQISLPSLLEFQMMLSCTKYTGLQKWRATFHF